MFASTNSKMKFANALLSGLMLAGYAVAQDDTYTDTTTFEDDILEETNLYRVRHQAPAATYNESMAEAAATYVSQCIFEHPSLYEQGSNLAAGFSNPIDVVDAWYNEVTDPGYNFSAPGPQTGTLHFTQLVWVASQQIGCGAYYCNGTNDVPGWYTACYYYPEGNVVLYGDEGYYFAINVLPAENSTSTTSSTTTAAATSSSSASTTATGSTSTTAAGSTGSATETTVSGSITGSVAAVAATSNPVATSASSSSSSASYSAIYSYSNNTSVIVGTSTITGSGSATTIIATGPTTISTDSALFIIHGSSTVSAGGASATATTVQLSFALPTAASKRAIKRQETVVYITQEGTYSDDAADAGTFLLVDGQLFSGASQMSTNADVAYEQFVPISPVGTITEAFDITDGTLVWSNSSFTINSAGDAIFAVSSTTVYAAFETLPADFTSIAITAGTVSATATGTATATGSASVSGIDIFGSTYATAVDLPECTGVPVQYVMVGGGVVNLIVSANSTS